MEILLVIVLMLLSGTVGWLWGKGQIYIPRPRTKEEKLAAQMIADMNAQNIKEFNESIRSL